MATSVYSINKGINKPIEFKGLKAQYIWYLAAAILLLLIVFAILYICGVNAFLCLAVVATCGCGVFAQVYRLSRKYGAHGMMKALARRRVPRVVKIRSRKIFVQLFPQDNSSSKS
jgi:hypothetical protein